MNTTETLSILPSGKSEIAEFSRKLEIELTEGGVSPLEILRRFKAMESVHNQIKPILDKLAREEAEKWGEKSFNTMGMKIELSENGTKYDYSKCGDPVYDRLKAEHERVSNALKAHETFLKGVKQPTQIMDEETGELNQVLPPVKSSISGLKITFQ